MKNLLGNEIVLPKIGYSIKRDGYTFRVIDVREVDDLAIIASITLKAEGGEIEIGYYDFLIYN